MDELIIELLEWIKDTIGTDNRFMQDWLRRYEDAKRLAERQSAAERMT